MSNPDKPYFPGITKADVVRYFLAVGDGILAAVRDRPTMLERWPGGMAGRAIFQRRPRDVPAWVRAEPDGIYPTELAVVAWAASLGTLRFHPSPVRADDPAHPDELRIDLDPQPGTGFADAVAVARRAARPARGPRPDGLPEDLRRPRRARDGADRAALELGGGRPRAGGARRASSCARMPRAGDDRAAASATAAPGSTSTTASSSSRPAYSIRPVRRRDGVGAA